MLTKIVTLLLLCTTVAQAQVSGGISAGDLVSKPRNSTPGSTDKMTPMLGIRNDSNASMSTADGRYTPLTTDSTGRLRTDATISEVATGADGAAAPALGKMAAGLDSGGNLQYMSVDTNGELQIDVLSLPGSLRGYAEDVPHVSGDFGMQMLAVRNDAGTALSADGDYHPLTVDSNGRLRVDASTTEVATMANGGALPALTKVVSGYDGANVRVLHTDASGDVQVDLASSLPAGNNNIGDVDVASQPARSHTTDSIRLGDGTDLTQVTASGELNVADTTTRTSLSSIDGKMNSLGQKTMANSMPVVIASDQSNVNVAVASALPAGTNNIGDVDVLTLPSLPAGNNNIGDVDVVSLPSLPAGTNNIGDVDVLTEPATVADGGALPATTKVMSGYDGANVQVIKTDTTGRVEVVPASNAANTNGSQTTGTVSTVITLTAPANAVGFMLQAAEANTANMRWRIGAAATTTVGQQLQPGRDTGYVPAGANISIIAESGTQEYQVQWVLSN